MKKPIPGLAVSVHSGGAQNDRNVPLLSPKQPMSC